MCGLKKKVRNKEKSDMEKEKMKGKSSSLTSVKHEDLGRVSILPLLKQDNA